MLDRNTLAALLTGISQNIAFNLDFIPADKLNWKPAPQANSALEIVNHVLSALSAFTGSAPSPAADLSSAKHRVVEEAQRFADKLRTATPEELAQPSRMGAPTGQFAALLVADTINHHGQITYIQTLLGDTESHFSPGIIDALA